MSSHTIKINVYISRLKGPIEWEITEKDTAEDVIIELCKGLKILPMTRQLFGLKYSNPSSPNAKKSSISSKTKNSGLSCNEWWLSPSQNMAKIKNKDYVFAVRFRVPSIDRLKEIDRNAYDYYFSQVKEGILNNTVPNLDIVNRAADIMGLCVTDMVRAELEDGETKQSITGKYTKFVPRYMKKRHRFFLRKPVLKYFEQVRARTSDVSFLKNAYLEHFGTVAPYYLVEEFDTLIIREGAERLYAAQIRVDPYDSHQPGISMNEEEHGWKHVCLIEDLKYITVRKEGSVEISRKNGMPLHLRFRATPEMISFVALLDGYYRLMCKSNFNLSGDSITPSLQRLSGFNCHGPVSVEFAHNKLAEKCKNEAGYFILRECAWEYDSYFIDVCKITGEIPKTYKVRCNIDGRYKLNTEEEQTYSSIEELVEAHRSEKSDIPLLHCLLPSDDDEDCLLFHFTRTFSSLLVSEDEESTSSHAAIIDPCEIHIFKATGKDSRSTNTTVYFGVWEFCRHTRIAIKMRKTEDEKSKNESQPEKTSSEETSPEETTPQETSPEKTTLKDTIKEETSLAEFLYVTNRWATVRTNSVVKLFGVTLYNPICAVMESLPLGSLDDYLSDPEKQAGIKEEMLVEAATHLANALYYLADVKFVHGNIRCHKALVAAHTSDSLIVKLADPGLRSSYSDYDLHWIPPDFHSEPSASRKTTRSDVWAYGTTLWEIFSYGKSPAERNGDQIKKFYSSSPQKYLPLPDKCPKLVYNLMKECWRLDRFSFKTPQGILRDLNRIYYQVYNAKLFNQYAEIPSSSDHVLVDLLNDSDGNGGNGLSVLSELSPQPTTEEPKEFDSNYWDDLNSTIDEDENVYTDGQRTAEQTNVKKGDYQPAPHIPVPVVTDPKEMRALSGLPYEDEDEEFSFNPTSVESIFELNKEYNLILRGQLGTGQFGMVFKGELHHYYEEEEPRTVAVKRLADGFVDSLGFEELDREITTMLKLNHPNVVRIVGRSQEPTLCLVMEFMEHGSLKNFLPKNKESLCPLQLGKFALDIAKGMAYLGEMNYVHRDLAARNVLVSECTVKISDFGLARFIDDKTYYFYKNPARNLPIKWYAPESIERAKFSCQSDVWSYGVTLYEMFTYGADPNLPIKGEGAAREICEALFNNIRLPMPPDCPSYIYDKIMKPCWNYEAAQRPNFAELCTILEDILPQI